MITMIPETAAVLTVLCGAGYLLYLYFRDRKPGEYVWVGHGSDPFKRTPRNDKPINDFAGEEEEEWSAAESEEE